MKSEKTKKNIKENTTRVVLNVPNGISQAYETMAAKRGITKTNMIIYAMSWFLDYNKSIDLVPKILQTIEKTEKSESIEIV